MSGADEDQLHPGHAILGHLGEALEDAHAHPAFAQGVAELIGQDHQPLVAFLKAGIGEQVLQDRQQAVGAKGEPLAGRVLVGRLEELHCGGLVLAQVGLERFQFLERVIAAQEGQEVIEHPARLARLLPLLPLLDLAQRALEVGVQDDLLGPFPFQRPLDGSEHHVLEGPGL